jgi:Arc/MetJ-type ribon-helix-helix transcriptional regulator
MSALTLPAELDDWVRSEVAAGRAESPDSVVAKAVSGYRYQIEALRKSLDDAVVESERDGYLTEEQAFEELDRLFPDEE